MTAEWWSRSFEGVDPIALHIDDERGGFLSAYPTDTPGRHRVVWWPFTGRRDSDIGPGELLDDVALVAVGDRWRAEIDGWPVRGPLDGEADTFNKAGRALWVLLYLLRQPRGGRNAPRGDREGFTAPAQGTVEQRARWRRVAERIPEHLDGVLVTVGQRP